MRQRVMIAIALAAKPKIIIADEPTTALDVTIQAQILKLMQDIKEKTKTSIILITHDMSAVAGFCDHVIVMYAGKIVESAEKEKLFKNPQHPYTIKLLQSIPRLDINKDSNLMTIEGYPPDITQNIRGCAFCVRCNQSINICKAKTPILKNIKKQITPEQIKYAFKETKKAGIKTHATIMFGLPGETKETIKETIDFVLELDPDYAQFPVAVPYPGTEFYEEAKEKNWMVPKKWEDHNSDCAIVEYPTLTRKEIEQASKLAYKKFYLRPKYIFRKIKDTRSLGEWKQLIKSGLNLFKSLKVK